MKDLTVEEIRVLPERCTGCRTCELVCSFHFTRAFGRKAGAIKVYRDEAKGEFMPIIYKKPTNVENACDLCSGEQTYLCVKYCVVEAIRVTRR